MHSLSQATAWRAAASLLDRERIITIAPKTNEVKSWSVRAAGLNRLSRVHESSFPGKTQASGSSHSFKVMSALATETEPVINADGSNMALHLSSRTCLLPASCPLLNSSLPSEEALYQQWIATQFSAAVQSSPPPRQKQEDEEKGNYYVNVGYAIRTLREELPCMFYRDLTYDIYRDDITFRDPLNIFSGVENYKLIFWALRFHGRIFFKALWVDVSRIWQPNEKVIKVKWSVRGLPRVPWEAQGHFDGTSEYKLDKDGKIYEHKVCNIVMNGPDKQPALASAMEMLRAAGVGSSTTPTPGFFRRVFLATRQGFPCLFLFTWVRFYWALASTLALNGTLAMLNS